MWRFETLYRLILPAVVLVALLAPAHSECNPPVGGPDTDFDCIDDVFDNCRGQYNPDQANADGDIWGDACDYCPVVFDNGNFDNEGDNVGNVCDNCPDDYNANQLNTDADMRGDVCDNDDDNDGLTDAEEAMHGSDPTKVDSDGDGVSDVVEVRTLGTDPADPDSDADGADDGLDNCPLSSNPTQADTDLDTRGDVCDNCPSDANGTQDDLDLDGTGDACDSDDDGDGVPDASDNCPFTSNPNQIDRDGDLHGDACDPCDHAPDLACLGVRPPLTRYIDVGSLVGCLRAGGDISCAFRDPRPPAGGGCPFGLAEMDRCCPPGALCAGPNVTLRKTNGSLIKRFDGSQLGFGPEDGFGMSVTLMPDLDGGGMLDLAIGAPFADPGGSIDAGIVVLVSQEHGAILRTFAGVKPGDQLGYSLTRVGEQGMVAAGAPGADFQGRPDAGEVSIYDARGRLERSFGGRANGGRFGASVQAIADLNGDGVAELLITAPASLTEPLARGEVAVFSLDGTRLARFVGLQVGDQFGRSAALLDNRPRGGSWTIAVGAPRATVDGLAQAGSVRAFTLTGEPAGQWNGDEPNGGFGTALASGSDLDGDGVGDLLIGSPLSDRDGFDRGGALLVSAGAELQRFGPDAFEAGGDQDHFGQELSINGDLNGDGLMDLFVYSPYGGSGEQRGIESPLSTDASDVPAQCGDGLVEGHEECDPGNPESRDCCTTSCQLVAASSTCRASTSSCDAGETCSGLSATCPLDATMLPGSVCNDGNSCTGSDQCSGLTCSGMPLRPAEITAVGFQPDHQTLRWNTFGATHDVLRGRVGDWPVGQTTEQCLAQALATNSLVVNPVPPASQAYWYLIRGRDACGLGTYGKTCGGNERVSNACP